MRLEYVYMTEDESRQQKATLLLELNEAEQELANLEEKARRISLCLEAIHKWLDDFVRANIFDGTSNVGNTYLSQLGSVNVLSDPKFASAMNFDEMKDTADKIKDVRSRIVSLTERKRNLGLK